MPYIPGTDLGGRRVDLGAIPLGGVDSAGVAWHLQGLEGWDSPDIRSVYSDREADHGAWASPVYLGKRPITLAGMIEAPDLASLDAATDQILAAVSLTDTTLVVYESTPKQSVVRRSGPTLVRPVTSTVAAYSLLVTAADPRRYSTTLQTQSTGLASITGGMSLPITLPLTITAGTASGQITLSNVGTFPTRPIFTIDGPVSDPIITVQYPDSTIRQLSYSDDIALGDELVIDTDAHTALLNGTVSRRKYLSGQWPEIPPGATVTVQWNASSYDVTALLTGTCRSAWI